MRKPRRHKSRFSFKKKKTMIICRSPHEGFYTKETDVIYLGDFGYHRAYTQWTIIHIPTGLDIGYEISDFEARIKVKKLFAKVWSGGWQNFDCFKTTFNLQVMVSEICGFLKVTKVPYNQIDCKINPEDDIPF